MVGYRAGTNADEEIDRKKNDGSYELTEAEREKRRKDSGMQMAMHT